MKSATSQPDPKALPRPRSLRARMLLYFGLVFTAGIFAVDITGLYGIPFIGYQGEYHRRRNEAFRDLAHLADTQKAQLLHLIEERWNDAATFCGARSSRETVNRVCSRLAGTDSGEQATMLLRSADSAQLSEQLALLKKHGGALCQKVEVADAVTGTVVASTSRNEIGSDVSWIPYLEELRDGVEEEDLTEVFDPRSGTSAMALSRVIKETADDRPVTAILVMHLKPDLLFGSLEGSQEEMGKSIETFLVNADQVLLTPLQHPLPDGSIPRPLETRVNTAGAKLAAEGNEGVIAAADYRGVPVLAAFRHLRLNAETGIGMVVKRDQAEVFVPVRQLIGYYALKAALLIILILGLTYVLVTRITGPIRGLSRTAREVEEGNLTARAPVEGKDEVAFLCRSFNSMVQRVQDWRSELEAEVALRTMALTTLNANLKEEIAMRKRVEEELRSSERRFRELLETVQMAAIMLDTEGRVIFCNDFLLDLTGWSSKEVLGQNWYNMFLPEEDRETAKRAFAEAVASCCIPVSYEHVTVTRSGDRLTTVWDNTLLRNADGHMVGIASLGHDVTEQRNLEEQLRQSQKMEAIGQLAGGVAHDFNNLLTVIIGNCELIKMKTTPGSQVLRHVDQILDVGYKGANLTRSLLAFSRKQLLQIRQLNVNDSVRSVENLLERVIGEDVQVHLNLAEETLPVMADQAQLDQVLLNLATNARDAMPDGGHLLIETRREDLDQETARLHGLEKGGGYAVIKFSDTGTGMSEETRGKIFDPFFTTKEVGKGTGLGLAMVFGTIKQHSGYIDVYSEPGEGTTFRIYLPLAYDGKAAVDHQPLESALGGNETVLVAEDNQEVRATTVAILNHAGYRVIEASDGEEAVALFLEHRDKVALVILDVIMPKMNGKEVYEVLKQVDPHIQVVFTTGYTADVLNRRMVVKEELLIIQKPVTAGLLLATIREVLDASAAASP